jgi:uncharacterized protein YoxC
MGNADLEDALQRLDRLTQEEARMANAELLRISNIVKDGVVRVDEGLQGVGRDVQDVNDNVEGVRDKVQEVDRRVQDVGEGVQDVRKTVQGIGDGVQGVQEMVQDVDDKVDQVNRELSFECYFPCSSTFTKFSQETASENAFELGSLLPIHPLIITLPATLDMKGQVNGSFVVPFSISGNPLVLSHGYTENVCAPCQFLCHQF